MAAMVESVDLEELLEAEPFLEETQTSKGIKSVGSGVALVALLGCAAYAGFWAASAQQSPHGLTAPSSGLNEDAVISFSSALCSSGVRSGPFCCPGSCGTCGGKGCNDREGGANCCNGVIKASGKICQSPKDDTCMVPEQPSGATSSGAANAGDLIVAEPSIEDVEAAAAAAATTGSTHQVWSDCHSHANCGDKHFGWRLSQDRDDCIKADCKAKGLIYPDHNKQFKRCDSGIKLPVDAEYQGVCQAWSECHSDKNCDGGFRDTCIQKDCEAKNLKYSGAWEKCDGGLLPRDWAFKGLCA